MPRRDVWEFCARPERRAALLEDPDIFPEITFDALPRADGWDGTVSGCGLTRVCHHFAKSDGWTQHLIYELIRFINDDLEII